jgi:NADH-quinone oxidoreductase subunit J
MLMVASSLLVVLSTNPVESVLYLILTFCNAGVILFLFNLEFFGLVFIIIYVGAVAVLFLFVIMMLNIKLHSSFFGSLTLKNVLLCLFLLVLVYIFLINFYLNVFAAMPSLFSMILINNQDTSFNTMFDTFYNIDVLGQVFYNYYLIYLPLAGFILLISLVGVIVLTLQFNKPKKTQIDFKQLSRTDDFVSFFNTKDN